MKTYLSIILPTIWILQGIVTTYAQVTPAPYSKQKATYTQVWNARVPEKDADKIAGKSNKEAALTTQYFDGLGRPIQTVICQGSQATGSSATDLVSPVYYDELGRKVYQFLPFVSPATDGNFKYDPFQQQKTFYDQQLAGQGETFYYAQTVYESSPLNRVSKAMAPGNSWVGNNTGIESKYHFNTPSDQVKIWAIATAAGFAPIANSDYQPSQLYKNILKDEHGKQVIEFKDKAGKVILKKVQNTGMPDDGTGRDYIGWLCTYYIYDDLGNLRCVIQPAGVEMLATNGWQLTQVILDEQCFRYEYDQSGRMTAKKVPGAGWIYLVYDQRDRLVFSQDANMRNQNQWLATLYDQFNRPVQTGILTWSISPQDLQNHVNQTGAALTTVSAAGNLPGGEIISDLVVSDRQPGQNQYKATQSITVTEGFQSEDNAEFTMEVDAGFQGNNTPFQVTQWIQGNPLPNGYPYLPLAYTYYDNYDNLPSGLTNFVETNGADLITTYNQAPYYAQEVKADNRTKGMVTWTQTRILGTDRFITAVNLYDEKGRVVQQKNLNATGGKDILTTQYDWSGKIVRTCLVQQKADNNTQVITVNTKNQYDDLDRLVKIEKNINNTGYKTIAQMEYDALGQLKKKILGPSSLSSGEGQGEVETQDFDYNIRGWLTTMNKNYITGQQTGHYFGYELGYDKPNTLIPNTSYFLPQYNGNISGQIWKSAGDAEKRKYDYLYDPVNRLTHAEFNQYTDKSFNKSAGIDYTVSNLQYDANGNIRFMNQMGVKGANSTMVDQLSYDYYPGSNKLLKVVDQSNDFGSKLGDFKYNPATKTGQDYTYDNNGNLLLDNNKDIQSIVYNYLNLPQLITVKDKGTIEYIYDAAGSKIKKIVRENGQTPKTTLYLGAAVYENDQLQFIAHEEGRARYSLSLGDGRGEVIYDYYIKDHLGNIRMVLTEETKTDVYPVATLEPANLSTEKQLYDIQDGNIVNKHTITGFTATAGSNYPNNNGIATGDTQNPDGESQQVYRINGQGNKTGLGITLKVMAGDKLDILGKSYYFQNNSDNNNNYKIPVESLVAGLLGGAATAAGQTHATLTELTASAGTITPIQVFLDEQANKNNTTSQKPRAYINYLLFDEQFKCVGSSSSQVEKVNTITNHALQNIQVAKNGYVYIYCSNESPLDVFFDNLQVVHTKGHIVSEDHYYPFGLAMAGVSSKAAGGVENPFKYNGKEEQRNEFSDGSGLEWLDYGARMYDNQIGRWGIKDPLASEYVSCSPYIYVLNNPISWIDIKGMSVGYIDENIYQYIISRWEDLNYGQAGHYEKNGDDWAEYVFNLNYGSKSDGTIIIVGGNDMASEGGISATTNFLTNSLKEFAKNNKRDVNIKAFSSDLCASTMTPIVDYVKSNHDLSTMLLFYGYSLGGHTANQAIKMLGSDNIKVDLFFAVDAALGIGSSNMEISSNVDKVINIYQTDRSTFPILSRGYPALCIPGNTNTKIVNINYDKAKSVKGSGAHAAIDEDVNGFAFLIFMSYILIMGK